jgi:hypothetical protein
MTAQLGLYRRAEATDLGVVESRAEHECHRPALQVNAGTVHHQLSSLAKNAAASFDLSSAT